MLTLFHWVSLFSKTDVHKCILQKAVILTWYMPHSFSKGATLSTLSLLTDDVKDVVGSLD